MKGIKGVIKLDIPKDALYEKKLKDHRSLIEKSGFEITGVASSLESTTFSVIQRAA